MSELDDALRSLRDDVHGESPRAHETRDVILATARRPKRNFRFLTLLAAAALFIGSAAWAGYTGRLRQWFRPVSTEQTKDVAPSPVASSKLPALAPAQAEVVELDAAVASEEIQPEVEGPLVQNKAQRVTNIPLSEPKLPSPSPPAASASASTSVVPSTEELETYERAHRAHFSRSLTALALWDAYLQKYPSGKWQPEARYNRAIALLRAGDTRAAKGALEPFANGNYGTYRKDEARSLLKSIAGDAGH